MNSPAETTPSLSEDRHPTSPPGTPSQTSAPSPTSTVHTETPIGSTTELSAPPSESSVATTEPRAFAGTESQSASPGRAVTPTNTLAEVEFEKFMKTFMPGAELPSETVLKIPYMNKTVLFGSEDPICEELCKVAQAIFDGCDQGDKLAARNTSHHPDGTDRRDYGEQLKVDVSFYPTDEDAADDYGLPATETPTFRGRTRWSWISLLVEVKTSHDLCAFEFDPTNDSKPDAPNKAKTSTSTTEQSIDQRSSNKREPPPFVRSGSGATQCLGQLVEYVSKVFRRQHRLHCFTLLVFKGQARVIRWDRAGAIVSTAINFVKDQCLLHKVIWRYACMSQEQRGFDPSVVRASMEDIEAMRAYQTLLQPLTDDMLPDSEPSDERRPLSTDETLSFIVGRDYFATDSLTGRGTKCYIAYDVSRRRLVFLKDYWRPKLDTSVAEGSVLQTLRAAGVRFVPTPVAAGDVYGDQSVAQETETQRCLPDDEKTNCEPVVQVHYRLVVKEIGRPLDQHSDAYELVSALFDALQAHAQAWETRKILHRDISATNILLFTYVNCKNEERTVGILNDWDLCKLEQYLELTIRPGRSGTWQFMPARLLRYRGKKHEVADDLESRSGSPGQLQQYVVELFESYDVRDEGKQDVGGDPKYDHMKEGFPGVSLSKRDSPLGKLLDGLASICREHYLAVEPQPTFIQGATTSGRKHRRAAARDRTRRAQRDVQPLTPTPTHDALWNIFVDALGDGGDGWDLPEKTEDQFESFKNLPLHQRGTGTSGQRSSGSKRASEGDSGGIMVRNELRVRRQDYRL
ncbi:hypothetical protein DAEQUDRAFT_738784 [Daedalea quercina L-15889]|uniref:Fungal-type protein kinase domain-containing protein n=1 Tax=Daedalea quercina L-15889 TaxID=1314783 RepID=A0A165PMQ3_9APHY|nr:hypothetical protein DAEQUDRAFT_738784 [Daedalea quercina L-15889]